MTGQPGAAAFGHHMLHEVVLRDLVSTTYRGTSLDQPAQAVAVRVVSRALAATHGEIDGFLRANSQVASVDHPHVLRVVDVGEHDLHPYVATVWRDGVALGDLLSAHGPLPVWVVVRLAGQLAEALDALHDADIVHGTLGPRTVWVKRRRRGQRALSAALTGFGTSHLLGAALHNASGAAAAQDVLFVAPEQVRDGSSDAASDQYALGCLLFMALTGAPPFTVPTNRELFGAHLRTPPPAITSLRPDLDPEWDLVVSQALDKDPTARFDNCRTLLQAVGRCTPPPDDAGRTVVLPTWAPGVAAVASAPLLLGDDPAHPGNTASVPPEPGHVDSAVGHGRPDDTGAGERPAAEGQGSDTAGALSRSGTSSTGPHAAPRRRGGPALRRLLIAVVMVVALVTVLALSGVAWPVDTQDVSWPAWLAGSE